MRKSLTMWLSPLRWEAIFSHTSVPADQRRRLARRLAASHAALWIERWVLALWPLLTLAGLVAAVVFADLLPRLPGWGHAAVLLLIVGAVLALIRRAQRCLQAPSAAAVVSFAEQLDPHHPLSSVLDQPAQDLTQDAFQAQLWQRHQQTMLNHALRLPLRTPRPQLAGADPWGLRVVAALALVLTLPVMQDAPLEKLQRALHPSLRWSLSAADSVTATVWVTPPSYTGQAPQRRDAHSTQPLSVPEGSSVLVLVQGAEAPVLRMGELKKDIPALSGSSANHRLDTVLLSETKGESVLAVKDGWSTVAQWSLTVTKDQPPAVALGLEEGEPVPVEGSSLVIPYVAEDDYGLTSLEASVERDGKELRLLSLPLPAGQKGEHAIRYHGGARVDLSSDPLAGQSVDLRLVVKDAGGAVSATAPLRVTIPERSFQNPLAREIIDWRRRLLADPLDTRIAAIGGLNEISTHPELVSLGMAPFLGLRVVVAGLARRDLRVFPPDLAALLWAIAVQVEDGTRADAEQQLAAAEQALDEALAANADPQTIAQRLDELRQAIRAYMQAMISGAAATQNLPTDQSFDVVALGGEGENADLESLLQQIQELEAAGAHEAAQALREKLREMLTALRSARMPDPAAMQAFQQSMQELRDLVEQQRALLERTFSQSQTPSDDPPQVAEALAGEQEDLRRRLSTAMENLAERTGGQLPPSFGTAEQEMRDASKALKKTQWTRARDAQARALDALTQGRQQAAQQMMQAMAGGAKMLVMPSGQGQGRPNGQNPLGRGPVGDDGSTKIPKAGEMSRGRDILMELRRRANDGSRPTEERDYINRLLKEF